MLPPDPNPARALCQPQRLLSGGSADGLTEPACHGFRWVPPCVSCAVTRIYFEPKSKTRKHPGIKMDTRLR